MRIGLLALQGDFAAHGTVLAKLGCDTRLVKRPQELQGLEGLVLPGGESTTLLRHFDRLGFSDALRRFAEAGGAFLATCAGTILLASEVTNPAQPSLGIADLAVERNGYGRQGDSFETDLELRGLDGAPFHAVFIRAPVVTACGPRVETLAEHAGSPVLVRDGRHLLATFHPELTEDDRIHRAFLAHIRTERPLAAPRSR